jgi:hypothetical protein
MVLVAWTAIPILAVALTGAVQPELCNTRQRRRSMLPTDSATTAARSLRRRIHLFFGMRRSERDRRRRRPWQKRGSFSLQHRSVLAYHFYCGEAYDQITAGTCSRARPMSLEWSELAIMLPWVVNVKRATRISAVQPEKLAFFDCLLLGTSQAERRKSSRSFSAGPIFGRGHSQSLTKIQIASKL